MALDRPSGALLWHEDPSTLASAEELLAQALVPAAATPARGGERRAA